MKGEYMKYYELGSSKIAVSEMGLGCMSYGARIDQAESFERMDEYVEAGGNFFDTANIYGRHEKSNIQNGSEEIIGKWLKKSGKRNNVIIASKVGFSYPGIDSGTSKKQIKEECEKSLKRLGVDYLDLYYLHKDDFDTPMEESLEAMQELLQEGKIRSIGASNFDAWRLEKANNICKQNHWVPFSCVQQRHTYLRPKQGSVFGEQRYVTLEMESFLKENNLILIAYSPLVGGAYMNEKGVPRQYISEDNRVRMNVLKSISAESGISANQLVYYWLMNSRIQAIPLIAPSSHLQFQEAIGTLKIDAIAYMERLNEAGEGYFGPDFFEREPLYK
ncbi:aldo/keto reductase [Dorea formicigenerans]